ncbi:helix-turn-helix domain-containing protein [Geobacillus zalihae]|uniref:helix-turn-helix domain-containing protein n=1 Tax=Geobacillus zalihae TaxID=213419 RepID=UPI000B340D54|nr:helix-turn-helix domain-containing protein [Geobacillus zalihae]
MKPKERFSIIQELSNTHPIAWLCQLAGVSRSGYYRWVNRQGIVTEKQKENEQIKQMILECHQKVNWDLWILPREGMDQTKLWEDRES